ncbi:glycosyltransferase [Gammaproteobacteria bacterium]|nr:glycosyltransferase [Gammaproteobacteria bacterium]
MKNILILSPYPEGVAAGQRLKYEQYYSDWEKNGYLLRKSSFFDMGTWNILWNKGNLLKKIVGTFLGYLRRLRDLSKLKDCDIVYIFMWATPIGFPFYEWIIHKSGKKIIYDFDDAVFASPDYFSIMNIIKGDYKSKFLIKNAHQIILSSPFNLSYCKNKNLLGSVKYIPCSLDLKRFTQKTEPFKKVPTLGWTGTFSSKPYLDSIKPMLYELKKHIEYKIIFITNFDYELPGLDLEVIRWSEKNEVRDLHRIDIGLYPLTKSPWSLGKGGLKTLQYMAAGIPTISTDFGTVQDFITNQKNGFLVNTQEDWINAVLKITSDSALRKNMISSARQTVEEGYSVSSNKIKYLDIFKNLSKI